MILISGQRSYFIEMKKSLQSEIERLNKMFNDLYFKHRELKKKYQELNEKALNELKKHAIEITLYKNQELKEVIDQEIQTNIEMKSMNKLIKNSDSVQLMKRFVKKLLKLGRKQNFSFRREY